MPQLVEKNWVTVPFLCGTKDLSLWLTFSCVPGMATILVVKVHCGGTHRPTTKEAQGTYREVGAGGIVE